MTSPSSSARQTPTATASWPMATWRKPGSSPARKRSSTFSSKRRMRSISRRKSFRRSVGHGLPLFLEGCHGADKLAARANNLRPHGPCRSSRRDRPRAPPRLGARGLELTVEEPEDADRAALILAPRDPGRSGSDLHALRPRRGERAAPTTPGWSGASSPASTRRASAAACGSRGTSARPSKAAPPAGARGSDGAGRRLGRAAAPAAAGLERPLRRGRARLERLPRPRRAPPRAGQPRALRRRRASASAPRAARATASPR